MGGQRIENVLDFCYLGSEFDAGGDASRAIVVRAAQAKAVCGRLRDTLTSDRVPLKARLRPLQ